MFNLSDDTIKDLYARGTRYLRVLGADWEDFDDTLSRAFLRLSHALESTDQDHTTYANHVWRLAVFHSYLRTKEDNRRHTVINGLPQEDTTQDTAHDTETRDFSHKLLTGVFDCLTDDDIIVLLAYIDCDLNIKDTAAYLHEQRTNMYHIIQRIREKVRLFYPDLRPAKHKGLPQPGQRKTSGFGINYNGLEYLDYDEWHPALYDREPQTVNHSLHAIGLVPGSSPTKHHLSEAVYDAIWSIQDQRPLDTRLARQQRSGTPGLE